MKSSHIWLGRDDYVPSNDSGLDGDSDLEESNLSVPESLVIITDNEMSDAEGNLVGKSQAN